MKTYISFLVVFVFFQLKVSSKETQMYLYYKYSNLAEIFICKNEYSKALNSYKSAFSESKISFAIDIQNAIVCATICNNPKEIMYLCELLSKKGVGKNYFSQEIFKKYQNDKSFQKIINNAEIIKNKFKNNNEIFINKYETLIKNDSLYNKYRHDSLLHMHQLPDYVQLLFERNTKSLLNLINEYGYYGENNIGVLLVNDTSFVKFHRANVILIHYLQMGTNPVLKDEIKNMLAKNIENGCMRNNELNTIMTLCANEYDNLGNNIYTINDCYLFKNTNYTDLSEINKTRNKYYLSMDITLLPKASFLTLL